MAIGLVSTRTPTLKSVSARGTRYSVKSIPAFNDWVPIYRGWWLRMKWDVPRSKKVLKTINGLKPVGGSETSGSTLGGYCSGEIKDVV